MSTRRFDVVVGQAAIQTTATAAGRGPQPRLAPAFQVAGVSCHGVSPRRTTRSEPPMLRPRKPAA